MRTADEDGTAPDTATTLRKPHGLRARVDAWITNLQRDPSAEQHAAEERRAALLADLNRTVAEAPDDVPIRYVINRLNRHWDD